ncbi:MAG: ergothioneine biosynthesis protein EgtB [Planctomycetaceae bacterium]|jgi:ergothioneine biosynthesis protein EgtB|nr:ergothioneine biosynthesis protein EgtB [Planctomycetaceae bacterium]
MSLVSIDQCRDLLRRFIEVRRFSERLVEPLSSEDCLVQSMPDVSPTKWHLAHTTWFFETFVLSKCPDYRVHDERYAHLFNSYYNTIGEQYPRSRRGMISRPTLADVMEYRRSVDESLGKWLEADSDAATKLASVVEIGLQHEQQHQELILTDIKHVLSQNPCWPVFQAGKMDSIVRPTKQWIDHQENICEIGFDGDGFCYDNEQPRHRMFVESYQICDSLVSCGEYLQFIEDGGYTRPEHWLSLGWQAVQDHGWTAPLYWQRDGDSWLEFTLAGLKRVELDRPVTHVSYFEADAFARWSEARLPTEAEWEIAAVDSSRSGNFVDTLLNQGMAIHPGAAQRDHTLFGDVWQWTSSPYVAYPGYRPPAGALGEYNGKFMCNQFVLRGGSVATSSSHIRPTYRNFFPADTRWQFSGIRLCR